MKQTKTLVRTLFRLFVMTASVLVFSAVTAQAQESRAELAESLVGSTWNYNFQGTDFPIVFGKSTIENLSSWKGVTWKVTNPNQVQLMANGGILTLTFDSLNSFKGIDWDGKTPVTGKRISNDNSKTKGTNYLIAPDSVGSIRLGMTVAEARKAMSGAKFSRTSDGDGVALIAVMQNNVELMTLYANEQDNTAPINENAVIENIEVWSSMYKTADGVHTQMKLSVAEKIYGNTKLRE